MGDNFSRILIRTTVRKAIRDIRETPRRSARNLIDMALNFAEGRFQQEFFQMAQKMLTDESSSYYALLQNMAMHIDEERLLTFGMNIGYNSGICGARRIRQLEESSGHKIPWMLFLEVSQASISKYEARYCTLVKEGEEMGIYTWMLYSHSCASACIELAAQYPDSAFILFCDHGEIDCTLIDCASELKNLMLVVPLDEDVDMTCDLLREAELLYSLYTTYTEADLQRIRNGDLFCDMEQLNPVFSVFIPKHDCPQDVRQKAYDAIHGARMAQTHATMLWELYRDSVVVDRIISGDACYAGFDKDGVLHSVADGGQAKMLGSVDVPLEELFKLACSDH